MTPHLRLDHVWKQFRRGQSHDSLRDLVPALARRLVGRPAGDTNGGAGRTFWAVRDLSFDVGPGDVLGIIGPNGAGKSTTLKLLNRIMEPTAGSVLTTGRIGALIEVSAGFHQDLTGRQNVFLQGAIMGMRKTEVEQKFDEIVAFAGVEDFLDTPVKRYSSGMNARLGFAIAAHLEPDILIIDEVLAVGDAAFQAKAFGRIKQMATGGAPVVLVSHQLDRIAELCTKAILLDKGTVRATGTPVDCINAYLHGIGVDSSGSVDTRIRFDPIDTLEGRTVYSGEKLTLVVKGLANAPDAPSSWTPALRIRDVRTGIEVHAVTGLQRGVLAPIEGEFEYHIDLQMNVQPGTYDVQVLIWDAVTHNDIVHSGRLIIEVLDRLPFYHHVQLNSHWGVEKAGRPIVAASSNGSKRA